MKQSFITFMDALKLRLRKYQLHPILHELVTEYARLGEEQRLPYILQERSALGKVE